MREKRKVIFLFRSFILIVLFLLTFVFYRDFSLYIFFSCFLILFTYAIYNSIRNNFNLLLYSFLVYCRYFIVFVFIGKSLSLAFFLYLIYPFCVTLEFSTKKRFITSSFMKFTNFDKFRLFYYAVILCLAIFLYLFSSFAYTDLFLYLSFYFCLYRLLSYFLLSKLVRSK